MQIPTTGAATPAEFADFMRAYQDMVFSTAIRLTASDTQAQDIAQEVFLKAFEHFAHLRHSPAAGGWLKTVATHLSLNHLSRYRRRWRFFSEIVATNAVDSDGEPAWLVPESLEDELFASAAAADRHRQVEAALMALPHHQRIPLVLYHFEDFSYDEIAVRLGVSLAKIRTDIHRARVRLAHMLLEHWNESKNGTGIDS